MLLWILNVVYDWLFVTHTQTQLDLEINQDHYVRICESRYQRGPKQVKHVSAVYTWQCLDSHFPCQATSSLGGKCQSQTEGRRCSTDLLGFQAQELHLQNPGLGRVSQWQMASMIIHKHILRDKNSMGISLLMHFN